MSCKECEEIDNLTCGCEEYCDCSIKLSTICSYYDGVKLKIINTYEGENLESVLLKVEELFKSIFEILNGSLYLNIGEGAKVYKRNNSRNQAEFRTILTSNSVSVVEYSEEIGLNINEDWLLAFLTENNPTDTNTSFVNVIAGHRIATYRSEDNTQTDINETVTSLTYNTDGTLTYVNESGVPSTFSIGEDTLTTVTNTVQGKRIATYINESGNSVAINETVTSMQSIGNQTLTYTNENGVTTSYRPTSSTTTVEGINAFSTTTQVIEGTNNATSITPLGLSARTATETRTGLQANATQAESNALLSTNKTLTPGRLPKASTTQQGIVRLATSTEISAGTSNSVGVTPAGLEQRINSLPQSIIAKADIDFGDFFSTGSSRNLTISNSLNITSAVVIESQTNDARIRVSGSFGSSYIPTIALISKGSWNVDNDTFAMYKNLSSGSMEVLLRQIDDAGGIQDIQIRIIVSSF
ncbi:tail fiber [Cellulophaga phage phi4:1]|uniref:Tail fiber n=3 Tax=Lightbulbvirus Cba41 TaxID=1918524 RepID=A0A0S2MWK9_9CAUD|nr:tail fiber protein [Cellulophaga phage phi4:1]AGO49459.1 tail fiber [Cellulophaga phage phi4:1]ALO80055.1 tail fiber [Cellulophaga phage phi4:1_13]ALO80252.1 tail fiber [Cellulophaga phage phi4:1_18]